MTSPSLLLVLLPYIKNYIVKNSKMFIILLYLKASKLSWHKVMGVFAEDTILLGLKWKTLFTHNIRSHRIISIFLCQVLNPQFPQGHIQSRCHQGQACCVMKFTNSIWWIRLVEPLSLIGHLSWSWPTSKWSCYTRVTKPACSRHWVLTRAKQQVNLSLSEDMCLTAMPGMQWIQNPKRFL